VSVVVNMTHMVTLGSNGKGFPVLDRIGDILEVSARICFLLFLMLLAKGWTISGDSLSGKKTIIFTVVSFTVCYICILIWKFAVENPAETGVPVALQVFEILLTTVWMFFAFWFIYSIYKSHAAEDNPVKKTLYRNLGFLYGLWFLALPFVVFVSFAFDPWVREKAVKTLQLSFTTIAYFVMAFLTWHSRAGEYLDITTPDVSKTRIDNYEQL